MPARRTRAALAGLPALLGVVGLLGLAAAAHAYVMFATKDGTPVRWKASMLTVRTSTVEPDELDGASIPSALSRSFDAWEETGCAPDVTITGTTDATHGTRPTAAAPTDNVFVFVETVEAWSALRHGSTEIAVTLVASNPETGELLDADFEVNDGGYTFSLADVPEPGEVDFIATMTHEIGHFYGLDHSLDRDATMYKDANLANLTTKRTLTPDDVDGVCALYATPWPEPPDPPDDCAGGAPASGAAGAALLALGRALAARARRRDPRADASGETDRRGRS